MSRLQSTRQLEPSTPPITTARRHFLCRNSQVKLIRYFGGRKVACLIKGSERQHCIPRCPQMTELDEHFLLNLDAEATAEAEHPAYLRETGQVAASATVLHARDAVRISERDALRGKYDWALCTVIPFLLLSTLSVESNRTQ
eukprot:4577067-Pleurochrysis_carterae.AAC.1